ncbi:MAG: 30S ribosomal protein S5 [Thermoplasmata archaeon]|nr:30S ribosomal protein S5 [Thermoplasmata archaeon]RLF70633.1 MAG: 30S ribosomal protein S5 [Thermoplasmata archaeon]RLF74590.1 MAG: 30S ribosomal protein S5 [Thermoplasmata archaeon]HDD59871.1 30S ribosomal protein S5 [Euryarchaeota archaeon]
MAAKRKELQRGQQEVEIWQARTKLGKMVLSGEITSMSQALSTGLPIREPEIVDFLLPDLEDEVLSVNMVQRMTDSGRRTKFSVVVVVGNRNGFVGLGQAKGKEVGPTIRKAIDNAKLNIFEIRRGCGSWECGCMTPHSIPYRVRGKTGSVEVTFYPAPRGIGLAVNDVAKKIMKLAGIQDAWGFSRGQTRTTVNNAKAVIEALKELSRFKVQREKMADLKIVRGQIGGE